MTDKQFNAGLKELKTLKPFRVDDVLIWTSPHTGQESEVSFRGYCDGQATIWTGRMQFTVPYEQLKKKGEK